jgi:hypothetical protein
MIADRDEATQAAHDQLLPLFAELHDRLLREQDHEAADFFSEIAHWIERSANVDELMNPFMRLATTAFHGFDLAPDCHQLVDRILDTAQTISWTISCDQEVSH